MGFNSETKLEAVSIVSAPGMAFPVTPSGVCSQFPLTPGTVSCSRTEVSPPASATTLPRDRYTLFHCCMGVPFKMAPHWPSCALLPLLCFLLPLLFQGLFFFPADESCSVGKPLAGFIVLFLSFLREEGPNKWNTHQRNCHGIYQSLLERGRGF